MKPKKTEPPSAVGTTIQNCTFTGVQWDAKAVEAVQTVAQALLNLTQLFRSQGIEMGPMVQIGLAADDTRINACKVKGTL